MIETKEQERKWQEPRNPIWREFQDLWSQEQFDYFACNVLHLPNAYMREQMLHGYYLQAYDIHIEYLKTHPQQKYAEEHPEVRFMRNIPEFEKTPLESDLQGEVGKNERT